MAHEAFALSPISARAASPTDADFEAIREAFLETARGRWFLDEYTRRNRNADTAMVLEAVERIEHSLAVQKEDQQRLMASSEPAPAEARPIELPSNPLPEAMAAVKAILSTARGNAAAALTGAAMEEMLAPSRKCARVIREIAWGLRESGADGRICAMLDSQVNAINAACDQIAASGFHEGVLRAFDQAALDIESITPPEAEPQAGAESTATIHVVDFRREPEEQSFTPAEAEPIDVTATPEAFFPEPLSGIAPPADDSLRAELKIASTETAVAVETAIAAFLEIAPDEPHAEPELETNPQPVAEMTTEPAAVAPVSTLGESLIAHGIVARPVPPRSDPLAPIRRMTQTERIAFFS